MGKWNALSIGCELQALTRTTTHKGGRFGLTNDFMVHGVNNPVGSVYTCGQGP